MKFLRILILSGSPKELEYSNISSSASKQKIQECLYMNKQGNMRKKKSTFYSRLGCGRFSSERSCMFCRQNCLCSSRRTHIFSPCPGTSWGFESIYVIILSITLQEWSEAIVKHLGESNRSDQRLGEPEVWRETERMRLIQSREKEISRQITTEK